MHARGEALRYASFNGKDQLTGTTDRDTFGRLASDNCSIIFLPDRLLIPVGKWAWKDGRMEGIEGLAETLGYDIMMPAQSGEV